jgi:hydrogenase/urease accessory protein HupE
LAMTQLHPHRVRIATLAAGLLPALAIAHHATGETSNFTAGALHSLGEADHIAGFVIVGMLAARLAGRYLAPIAAVVLGLLVAAWTSDADGWRYAAGFMLAGACLVAAGITAERAATRLTRTIATAPRSPTSAAAAGPAPHPSSSH